MILLLQSLTQHLRKTIVVKSCGFIDPHEKHGLAKHRRCMLLYVKVHLLFHTL